MSKVLFVGGTFDDNGGRASSLVNKFYEELKELITVDLFNGGFYDSLEGIISTAEEYDYVIWWANVPNDKPKIRNVKEVNQKCILVTSKRNDNEKYSFSELINRALGIKANLCVEFSRNTDGKFNMMIFDPLGNDWYSGNDISNCAKSLIERMMFLKCITRQSCLHEEGEIEVPDEKEFFNVIKSYAEVFHSLIQPDKGVTRFLGNSSFRCQRGFPSFRKDGLFFVSQRNVDKRYIGRESFVPITYKSMTPFYYGNNKPSVDTPIQVRLYQELPNINYMMHAHVYIKDAPFTDKMIPCGGLEEVEEILRVIGDDKNKDFYAINLLGHGCIFMVKSVDQFENIPYISRPMPEKINETKENGNA